MDFHDTKTYPYNKPKRFFFYYYTKTKTTDLRSQYLFWDMANKSTSLHFKNIYMNFSFWYLNSAFSFFFGLITNYRLLYLTQLNSCLLINDHGKISFLDAKDNDPMSFTESIYIEVRKIDFIYRRSLGLANSSKISGIRLKQIKACHHKQFKNLNRTHRD